MFTIINGIQVDLKNYIDNDYLIEKLENDEEFVSRVSFGFEKEFSWADDEQSGDEILAMIVEREIKNRIAEREVYMKTTRVEITLEQTKRVCMEFDVTDEQLEMLYSGKNPFMDEMVKELDGSFQEYDYAVSDMEGKTLVDWS